MKVFAIILSSILFILNENYISLPYSRLILKSSYKLIYNMYQVVVVPWPHYFKCSYSFLLLILFSFGDDKVFLKYV